MLQANLQSEGLTTIYYNAWENDFSDDPFIAFVGEIEERIENGVIVPDEPKRSSGYLNKVKETGLKLTPLAIKLITRGTLGSIDEIKSLIGDDSDKQLADFLTKLAAEEIKGYRERKKSMSQFKEHLQNFVGSVAKQGNRYPIVFFIDELDRCRPNYVLELLERIKHLFSVAGIVFVLAVDKKQLVQSVKSLYGLQMDPEGYLRKFIDLEYQLPQPSSTDFCNYLIDSFGINELLLKRQNQIERCSLCRYFVILVDMFDISLRVQAQCFMQINMVLRTTVLDEFLDICYLTFLTVLKSRSALYNAFNNREINDEQFLSALSENYDLNMLNEFDDHLKPEIVATIKRAYKDHAEYEELVRAYKQKKLGAEMSEKERTIHKNMAEYLCRRLCDDIHELMVKKLEIVEQFQIQDA